VELEALAGAAERTVVPEPRRPAVDVEAVVS
jgi:hypothetical protein